MRWSVWLVAGLASACASPTAPNDAPPMIVGRVLDCATGAGVPGATLQFRGLIQGSGITIAAMTRADGLFSATLPATGYDVFIDGVDVGLTWVTPTHYRADFIEGAPNCIARYGQVTDQRTLLPIMGATVQLWDRAITTDSEGWYRINLGCPDSGRFGLNTSFIYFDAPGYVEGSYPAGHGTEHVERVDIALQHQ